jgi:hypothetical protein
MCIFLLALMLIFFGCASTPQRSTDSSKTEIRTVMVDDTTGSVRFTNQAFDPSAASKMHDDLQEAKKYENVVIATVNGEPIYKNDFLAGKARHEFGLANAVQHLDGVKKSNMLQLHQKSDTELLAHMIQKGILMQECEKAGIMVDEDVISREVWEHENDVETANPEGYNDFLSMIGCSKEAFVVDQQIPLAISEAKRAAYLRQEFPEAKDANELNAAFEKRMQELRGKYEIVIY